MCATCKELRREIAALRRANEVVRRQNIRLAVECSRLRAAAGLPGKPLVLDHRTAWEMEAGQ